MPRAPRRSFPQLGGEGTQYQVTSRSGEPRFTDSGAPEMAWKFPYADLHDPANQLVGASNFAHSIESASAEHVAEGKLWYPKVNEAVRKGISSRGFLSSADDKMLTGSAMVAAVSPNMDWESANIHAFKEIRSLKGHQWADIMAANTSDDHASAKASQEAARSHLIGLSISRAPLPNVQKVGRLLQGEHPDRVLDPRGAPKTNRFMHNINDPTDNAFATVDGRANDTIYNRLMPWTTGRGISSANLARGTSRYEQAENIIRGVSNQFGLSSSEGQAISWVHMKALEQHGGRSQGPARTGQPYFDPRSGHPVLHNWARG